MVDLATLTGAIIVSLGSEYAGLFSNDDELSKKLLNAGEKVNEKFGIKKSKNKCGWSRRTSREYGKWSCTKTWRYC